MQLTQDELFTLTDLLNDQIHVLSKWNLIEGSTAEHFKRKLGKLEYIHNILTSELQKLLEKEC